MTEKTQDKLLDVAEPGDTELIDLELEVKKQLYLEPDDLVGNYFKEVNQYPLLSREEELDLCRRVKLGVKFTGNLMDLKMAEETPDGREAFDKLVECNLRLPIWQAKKYVGKGIEFPDLIQIGNRGLINAVAKYDPDRGFRFSTYATWWVKQAIQREVIGNNQLIRIPVHKAEKINGMTAISQMLAQRLGRQPTHQEIAQELQIDLASLEQMLQQSRSLMSLDKPIDEDGEDSLFDIVADRNQPEITDVIITDELRRDVIEVLRNLSNPRERLIVMLRLGFLDGKTLSLEEIGQKLGITRERVRQIEVAALKKINTWDNKRKLREYRSDLE